MYFWKITDCLFCREHIVGDFEPQFFEIYFREEVISDPDDEYPFAVLGDSKVCSFDYEVFPNWIFIPKKNLDCGREQ